ncbi:MAG: hypothetical protein ABSG33_11645 [Candidatus Bathyarchaeia archaeon]
MSAEKIELREKAGINPLIPVFLDIPVQSGLVFGCFFDLGLDLSLGWVRKVKDAGKSRKEPKKSGTTKLNGAAFSTWNFLVFPC